VCRIYSCLHEKVPLSFGDEWMSHVSHFVYRGHNKLTSNHRSLLQKSPVKETMFLSTCHVSHFICTRHETFKGEIRNMRYGTI